MLELDPCVCGFCPRRGKKSWGWSLETNIYANRQKCIRPKYALPNCTRGTILLDQGIVNRNVDIFRGIHRNHFQWHFRLCSQHHMCFFSVLKQKECTYRVSQKIALSECCWRHSALAQAEVASTPCVWKLIFRLFLTKTKPDQAFPIPSHVHGTL